MHDWAQAFSRLYNAVPGKTAIPTRQQFENMKTQHGDDPLSFVELDVWLKSHKNVRVVTDVKQDNLRSLAYIQRHATDQRQYIPQIYNSKEYEPASEMGYEDVIFTLYQTSETNQEILEFASDHRLLALTMWPKRATKDQFAGQAEALGIPVFVHTVNDCSHYSTLRKKGIYGVYTDLLNNSADGQDCIMYVKETKT
jgi:glycerophosphoryl diester phosphodiesterase